MTSPLWLLAIALVIAGIAGLVLPALPGTILIFAGLLVAAWADGFTRVGPAALVLIGAIAALSYGVELAAGALGAKSVGASTRAVVGAALGIIVGAFLGVPGLILGPLVGATLGEWTKHRDLSRASRVGAAAWLGFLFGSAVKIALAFSMIAIFVTAMLV